MLKELNGGGEIVRKIDITPEQIYTYCVVAFQKHADVASDRK